MKIDLTASPYHLRDAQIAWVNQTFKQMTLEEKVGQILCPSLSSFSKKTVQKFTKEIPIGSMMIRPFPLKGLQENIRTLQASSKIPLLISANLEGGANNAITEGTLFNQPMGCTATGNQENGYRLGKIACQEAAAVGVKWAYAPVVDIDLNYANPITNLRSFGNNKEDVIQMSRGYIKGAKEAGVIPTIKHFPGDGVDERDQHLLVSVNSLSYDDWMNSFGTVYQTLINEGIASIMIGHIAQPSVARALHPQIEDKEALMPASQSEVLMTNLLRKKMGFNGVIVTDSTLMVGYMQHLPRRLALPRSIECGADIILFSRNLEEDFSYLLEACKNGLLSSQRLDAAVIRILALKASMNLHLMHQQGTLVPKVNPLEIIQSPQTKAWTKECADHAITLVKDTKQLLPLSPNKTKRVYLNVIENTVSNTSPLGKNIKSRLEKEGFAVDLRKRALNIDMRKIMKGWITPSFIKIMKEISATTESFVSKYDMAIILLNMETESNATVVRVDWKVFAGLGNDIPWYAGEMPLVVVSTANPYHLLDIPMAHTYINAYVNNEATLDALFDKMMGRSPFKGVSPVDAFCGHEDCKL
jgi:beta-N-acetylhexosaminidase